MTEQPRPVQTDDGLVAVVADLVVSSPRKARRAVILNVLAALVAIALASVDVLMGSSGLEPYRLAGMVLGISGLSLLGVSYVLHHATQQDSVSCSRFSFFRLRSQVLHRVFLALPVMAIVATVLMGTAVGLFIPSVIAKPIFLIVVALFATYIVIGVRTVTHTSRFLYSYAKRQAEMAAQAQAEATEAQLSALQAQMNPHFLFNALNTVASLIRTDDKAAERTVEHLSDVLRRTLDRSQRSLGTVRDELEYLEAYLAIEQERWGDRLRVDWNVAPETLSLPLPPMTLQPLVENALRHGLGNRLEGGRVEITAARENGVLRLTVADDGVGFLERYREGTGLGNLRSRLATLYGEDSRLWVEPNGDGAIVIVQVPVSIAAED